MSSSTTAEALQVLLAGEAVLDSLLFTPGQLSLGLENDCLVQAGKSITHVAPDGGRAAYDVQSPGAGGITFHRLVGRRLTGVVVDGRTLSLTFEGGDQILVDGDEASEDATRVIDPDGAAIAF